MYPSKMAQSKNDTVQQTMQCTPGLIVFCVQAVILVLSWFLSPAKNLPRGNCTLLSAFPWLREDSSSYHFNLVCPSHGSLKKKSPKSLNAANRFFFFHQQQKSQPSFPLSVVINNESPSFYEFLVWFGSCLVWLVLSLEFCGVLLVCLFSKGRTNRLSFKL